MHTRIDAASFSYYNMFMVHSSLPPRVCGSFNPVAAQYYAEKLLLSRQRVTSDVEGSRHELPQSQNAEILHAIDYVIADPSLTPVSTQIFIQNLAKPTERLNNNLHFETHNTGSLGNMIPVSPLSFLFGFSSHSLGVIVGDIDFEPAIEAAGDSLPDQEVYLPEWLLEHHTANAEVCIQRAIDTRRAQRIDSYQPGDILHMPKGTLHIGAVAAASQPPQDIPRLSIRQFLGT